MFSFNSQAPEHSAGQGARCASSFEKGECDARALWKFDQGFRDDKNDYFNLKSDNYFHRSFSNWAIILNKKSRLDGTIDLIVLIDYRLKPFEGLHSLKFRLRVLLTND